MEESEYLTNANKLSNLDIRLELPPNQDNTTQLSYNLIGKLISTRSTGTSIVRDVLYRAWRPTLGLEVKRLNKDTFLFSFQHEADLQKAFQRRPWSIRGGHLILKKWRAELSWNEVSFATSTFWVQFHGLSALWQSSDKLRKIGSKVGSVSDIEFAGREGEVWRRFSRIQVEVSIAKPLLPGFFCQEPTYQTYGLV